LVLLEHHFATATELPRRQTWNPPGSAPSGNGENAGSREEESAVSGIWHLSEPPKDRAILGVYFDTAGYSDSAAIVWTGGHWETYDGQSIDEPDGWRDFGEAA
jgi:hypothetical protein